MRCYGINKKVADCDWEYLKTLRTLQAPHEPMPRLVDVLEYLRQPGRENFWILLDIKVSKAILPQLARCLFHRTNVQPPLPSSPMNPSL